MKFEFHTCDVFTRTRFGGNPLAVLPDARGLDAERMQQIAREFNYSETTFVLPPEAGHDYRVRIFTPAREVAFAGHPNIGTAFVLASTGMLGDQLSRNSLVFEEEAGLVEVRIDCEGEQRIRCELSAPQGLSIGSETTPERAAAALGLEPGDLVLDKHPPIVASVGLPFLIVEVDSLEALGRARMNAATMEDLQTEGISPDVLFYTHESPTGDIRARMFAPLDGVPEDPATGSANCALAALLAHLDAAESGDYAWRIDQGVEMGRPSVLEARVIKDQGRVSETRIGGDCVMVSRGQLTVD